MLPLRISANQIFAFLLLAFLQISFRNSTFVCLHSSFLISTFQRLCTAHFVFSHSAFLHSSFCIFTFAFLHISFRIFTFAFLPFAHHISNSPHFAFRITNYPLVTQHIYHSINPDFTAKLQPEVTIDILLLTPIFPQKISQAPHCYSLLATNLILASK